MKPPSGYRAPLLAIACLLGTATLALSQVNGSEEVGPLTSFTGPTLTNVPPPPPPQPVLGVRLRVEWERVEVGMLELRLSARGTPGGSFLVGLVRPAPYRPMILTAATLDLDGAWSMRRLVSEEQARALSATSFALLQR